MNYLKTSLVFIAAILVFTSLNGQKENEKEQKPKMVQAPMRLIVQPLKFQQSEYTVVVKMTGVRGVNHNGDCNRIHGTLGLNLKTDVKCHDWLKPFSGERIFYGLRDRNTRWERNWTVKRIAKWEKKEVSPRNHSYTAVYKVKGDVLHADGFGLDVRGFFQGCHKKDDFSQYSCAVVYHVNRRINLEDVPGTKQYVIGTRSGDGQVHGLKFYVEVSIK